MAARYAYVAAAAATIGIGLWLHHAGGALSSRTRDVLGDALWAAMMLWWVSAALPNARLLWRSVVAYGICVVVELSQLVDAPAIDDVRSTTIGQLVLGSGFDARDLLAYAAGVLVAALIARAFARN